MENQKNDNLNMLEAIVQNTEMGKNTLDQLVPMADNEQFKAELLRQRNIYRQLNQEAHAAIDACGGSAQGQSTMAKLNTKVSIGMKTITDKSTRNLAEMLTQGSSMGVMDCIKSQKDYPDAAPGSKRLMQKLPTLDYLSWADRGMPRPETYTKENLTDYGPRIEQLANYPWKMTKEMRSEAKEVIKTARPVGGIGGGSLWNFAPFQQANASNDDEAAMKWADLFYKLDGNVHSKQYALMKGLMDGTGYTSLVNTTTQLSPLKQPKQEFQAFQNGADLAAKKEPSLYSTTNLMGTAAQLWLMRQIGGAGLGALGLSGPLARVLQGMLSVGGSEAIQNLGDFVAGKMTPEQYWTSVEHGVRTGGALAGLIELIPAAKRDFMDRFSQRKAGKGGSTALVPATSAPEPVGMEEELPMPEEEYYEAFERGFNYDEEDNDVIVAEEIGRSVGAKARNYDIYNSATGKYMHLTEGTRIIQPKNHVIAGKGRNNQIDIIDLLLDRYQGDPLEWTKEKGFGYVDDEFGDSRFVEIHWYQEPSVGKVEFKIKIQPDGSWYLDD